MRRRVWTAIGVVVASFLVLAVGVAMAVWVLVTAGGLA